MNKPVLHTFLSSAAWSFTAAVATKLSVVVTGVLVARELGAQSFGEYGLIQSAIVMLANVVAQATTTATAKHIGQYKHTSPEKTGRGIALTLCFCVFFCSAIIALSLLFPVFLTQTILGCADLKGAGVIVVSIITLVILSGWTQGCLTGWEQYRCIALINAIIAIMAIPITYLLTIKYQMKGALLGLAGAQLATVFWSALACWRTFKATGAGLRLVGALTQKHIVLSVGLPVLCTGLMVAPINWYGNKLLVETVNGLAALGVYVAAVQWHAILSHVSVVLGSVLLPMLAANSLEESRKLDALNSLSGWLVVLVLIQPLIMFPEMITKLYGHSFHGHDFEGALIWLLLGSLVSAFKSGIARKMIVQQLAWYSVLSNLVWGLLFIVGVMLLREEGAIGIAKAFVGSQVIHFIAGMPYFIRKRLVPLELLVSPLILMLWAVPLAAFISKSYVDDYIYRSVILSAIVMYILASIFALKKMFSTHEKTGLPA